MAGSHLAASQKVLMRMRQVQRAIYYADF
jgi:hypothetical protein